MNCPKKQICNVCEAPFKMERGCALEKRCPACRFLGLTAIPDQPFELGDLDKNGFQNLRWIKPVKNSVLCPFDESLVLERYLLLAEGKELSNERERELDLELMMDKEELQDLLSSVLSKSLNEREYAVIILRFGLVENRSAHTLKEVAKILKVTRERVRQIESGAIKKLKHPKYNRSLKQYMWGGATSSSTVCNANYNPLRGGKRYNRSVYLGEKRKPTLNKYEQDVSSNPLDTHNRDDLLHLSIMSRLYYTLLRV